MRRLYLFAVFLVLYEFTTFSANDMIMPGMVAVVNEFNAPLSQVAWSLSLFMLGECCSQLWLGPLADRYGKRRLILWGNFTFLIFTIVIATSQSITQFMLGRWLQGSGMAFIAMGYAIIHENFNDKQSVKLIAIMSNVSILAPLIGPLLGGIIVSYSSWHYIFALTGVLGLISFCGLYLYTPPNQQLVTKLSFSEIIRKYRTIASNKIYRLGVLCTIINAIPLILWIGLAPNLILHNLQLSYRSFIIYQIITISGMSIASILMQFVAGRWKFADLILHSTYLALAGLVFSFIGHSSIILLTIGLLIYGIGFGLGNGCLFRIVMSDNQISPSMAASLMTFSQTLLFTIGLQISDYICSFSNYSALAFSSCCLASGLLSTYCIRRFTRLIANRQWQ